MSFGNIWPEGPTEFFLQFYDSGDYVALFPGWVGLWGSERSLGMQDLNHKCQDLEKTAFLMMAYPHSGHAVAKSAFSPPCFLLQLVWILSFGPSSASHTQGKTNKYAEMNAKFIWGCKTIPRWVLLFSQLTGLSQSLCTEQQHQWTWARLQPKVSARCLTGTRRRAGG